MKVSAANEIVNEIIPFSGNSTRHCSDDTNVNISSHIVQYPFIRIAQTALYFTSLADLFNQTPPQAFSHILQLMCDGSSYTYLPFIYSQVFIYTAG